VPLNEEQWLHYESVKHDLLVKYDGQITPVANVLVQLLRLSQITAGFLPTPEGMLRFDNPKLAALLEIVDEVEGKIIVCCMFHEEIRQVVHMLNGKGVGCVQIHGGVSTAERSDAQHAFQTDAAIRVMVMQIATGGLGITLTEASFMVYMTNSYSWGDRAQSEDRAHRVGLKHNVTYIDLLGVSPSGKKTIDHKVFQVVQGKKSISDEVLGEGDF
jgi:SNF2 family DNA or RNA helicase